MVEKPTRLAIGMEGGFDGGQQKQEMEETLSVVAMPELTSVPWPSPHFPPQVDSAVVGCAVVMVMCSTGGGVSEGCAVSLHSQQARRHCSMGWGEETSIQVSSPVCGHALVIQLVCLLSRHAASLQQLDNGVKVPPR